MNKITISQFFKLSENMMLEALAGLNDEQKNRVIIYSYNEFNRKKAKKEYDYRSHQRASEVKDLTRQLKGQEFEDARDAILRDEGYSEMFNSDKFIPKKDKEVL